MKQCRRSIHFVNNVYSNYPKSYETFLSSLYIHKMILCQFQEILEKFYVLSILFYNTIVNRSLNCPSQTFEIYTYFSDMSYSII